MSRFLIFGAFLLLSSDLFAMAEKSPNNSFLQAENNIFHFSKDSNNVNAFAGYGSLDAAEGPTNFSFFVNELYNLPQIRDVDVWRIDADPSQMGAYELKFKIPAGQSATVLAFYKSNYNNSWRLNGGTVTDVSPSVVDYGMRCPENGPPCEYKQYMMFYDDQLQQAVVVLPSFRVRKSSSGLSYTNFYYTNNYSFSVNFVWNPRAN